MKQSEQIAKTGGRPRVMSAEDEAMIRERFPELKSARARQNQWYLLRALRLVNQVKGLEWLGDMSAINRGDDSTWRPQILTELGRFKSDDDLLAAGAQLCALRPSVADGVRMVREWRTGKRPKHDPARLASAVCDVLNRHMEQYPDCTVADACDVLWDLLSRHADEAGRESGEDE